MYQQFDFIPVLRGLADRRWPADRRCRGRFAVDAKNYGNNEDSTTDNK